MFWAFSWWSNRKDRPHLWPNWFSWRWGQRFPEDIGFKDAEPQKDPPEASGPSCGFCMDQRYIYSVQLKARVRCQWCRDRIDA